MDNDLERRYEATYIKYGILLLPDPEGLQKPYVQPKLASVVFKPIILWHASFLHAL